MVPERKLMAVMLTCLLAQSLLGTMQLTAAESVAGDDAVPGYTQAQFTRGEGIYAERCASCHGRELEGFGLVPGLGGELFAERWVGRPLTDLLADIRRMPPGEENTLAASDHGELLAFILGRNGVAAADSPLGVEAACLENLVIPESGAAMPVAAPASSLRYATNGPIVASPLLDNLAPVTASMLLDPPPQDWLNWRRTLNAWGHSPLAGINRDNIQDLQLAWSWSLPAGANMMVPLVHDGVMFTYSFGDVVQAFDAATGELLWGWQRNLDPGRVPDSKKGLAIAGDSLIVPTSDMHLVALDMKTGRLQWDHKVDVGDETGHWFKSAPVIVNDKAIIGLTGRQAVEGGDFIVAVDLQSGREAWRFWTVARPGEPGGDTWNGLPLEQRTGGSVWIPGSYDPQLNLVYFGPAPTYDTERLRPHPDRPGLNNDALYTNSTVALDADSGRLVWHYQHTRNDQLDHDWAFERQIMELPVNGELRKAVVTGGKLGIFEAMDAATGEYLWSVDLDMQNVIAEIDPRTGAKIPYANAVPALDAELTQYSLPGICPDWLGARNMQSAAYNPATRRLFIPLSDTCLDDVTGQRWQKFPDPSTDGTYGIIVALDLETREAAWTVRQPGPQAAANLTTDGGLLFIGSVDRWFKALDQDTGEVLWQRRLDNAVNSYPVTYEVNGRQYIAVATNSGGIHTRTMRAAAGITLPPEGATLWVFALPDR